MTTWKDGSDCGRIYREIVNEDESHVIAKVRIRRSAPYRPALNPVRSWPEGEANFRLVLAAPQMLEALNTIAEGAIVSSDQTPEKIAEQVLRVLRLVREQNTEYLLLIGAQQQRAERAEAALETIVALDLGAWCEEKETVCDQMYAIARAAIAAVKGENSESLEDSIKTDLG